MAELKTPLLAGGISEVVSPLLMPQFSGSDPPDDDSMPALSLSAAEQPAPSAAGDALFRISQAPPQQQENEGEEEEEYWYSNPLQISAMISNFSTSYNVVNISLVLPILEALHQSSMQNGEQQQQQPNEDAVAAVASSLLAGMMLGQVLGGLAGDLLGAGRALTLVMALQVAASLGSAVATTTHDNDNGDDRIYWQLAAWRFVLGVGAGGVYPLAATLSASASGTHHDNNKPASAQDHHSGGGSNNRTNPPDNGDGDDDTNKSLHRVVLTFSTQGLGFVAVPLVAVPLLYTVHDLNAIWRIILGLGCVPGLFLMCWQNRTLMMRQQLSQQLQHAAGSLQDTEDEPDGPETTTMVINGRSPPQHAIAVPPSDDSDEEFRDQSDEENESILDSLPDRPSSSAWTQADAASPAAGEALPPPPSEHEEHHGWWDSVRHEEDLGRKLLGTAATWFLFDVLFYGNTLFEPVVIEAAFGARQHTDPLHLLQRTAMDSLLLTLIALPGYGVAGWVLGKQTRWCYCGIRQTPRFVMLQGFAAMAILYLVIGVFWRDLRQFPALLVTLYGFSFFFANYGPNTTTFVLPSLVYSPECRSTFNGLSAAAGKLGALTGASLFEAAADALGDAAVMLICAGIAVVALLMTKAFVVVPKQSELDEYHEALQYVDDGNGENAPREPRSRTIV